MTEGAGAARRALRVAVFKPVLDKKEMTFARSGKFSLKREFGKLL